MHSVGLSLRIARIQLCKWPVQAKVWIVLIMVPLILHPALRPVAEMANAHSLPVSPMGIVFVFSDIYNSALSVLFGIGAVLLFSDAPYYDAQQQQCLLRSSRRIWISGQLIYVLALSLLYVLYWIIWYLIMLPPNPSLLLEWGKVWNTLAFTSAYTEYGVILDCPVALIRQYTPAQSMILSLGLKTSLCMLFGCLMFAVGMWSNTNAGVYASVVLVLQDYLTMNGKGLPYIWFAPASMSRLVMLDPHGTNIQPTPGKALAILWGLIVVCVILSFGAERKTMVE